MRTVDDIAQEELYIQHVYDPELFAVHMSFKATEQLTDSEIESLQKHKGLLVNSNFYAWTGPPVKNPSADIIPRHVIVLTNSRHNLINDVMSTSIKNKLIHLSFGAEEGRLVMIITDPLAWSERRSYILTQESKQ